jgi:hypothetical protein
MFQGTKLEFLNEMKKLRYKSKKNGNVLQYVATQIKPNNYLIFVVNVPPLRSTVISSTSP